MQIAIAQELTGVPTFRRQEGQTAFVEGWALYAEHLAKDLGLYTSDESDFGRLTAEIWRALRLVVDTGIHAQGWSREQAIKAMSDGAAAADVETVNEVDRYITWPGQALAYKVGELEIERLRKLAESKIKNFDLRAFHDQVLMRGAIPIALLSRFIERWIDEQSAAPAHAKR
jgi:prolyl oligopeptidase